MKKYIRTHIKQEKRLIKLIIQKGLLPRNVKIKDLYWAEYATRKSKSRNWDYLPEVHYGTQDYWGEGDEHSVVGAVTEELYWGNLLTEPCYNDPYPKSSFHFKSRRWFIKYLEKVPTKVITSGLHRKLKRTYD